MHEFYNFSQPQNEDLDRKYIEQMLHTFKKDSERNDYEVFEEIFEMYSKPVFISLRKSGRHDMLKVS